VDKQWTIDEVADLVVALAERQESALALINCITLSLRSLGEEYRQNLGSILRTVYDSAKTSPGLQALVQNQLALLDGDMNALIHVPLSALDRDPPRKGRPKLVIVRDGEEPPPKRPNDP
jgi:hypothetical protein